MDGQKSHTSKVINSCFSFSGIALNRSMVLLVLFHRFTLVAWMTSLFMRSRMFLMMTPISYFLGLMSLQVGLSMKSGLWSFSVMKESLDAKTSIQSASSIFSAIFLSSRVIMSGTFGFVFL